MADAMQAAADGDDLNSTVTGPTSPHRGFIRVVAAVPLLAASALLPCAVLAQDFTVFSGDVVGQQVMSQIGDRGVIEAGGTVITGLATLHGVGMLSADQMLENFGLITTTGNDAYGILSTGADATIANSGTVMTIGDRGFGIASTGPNATIANSGRIATTAFQGYGISSEGGDATITNSGTIVTTGFNAAGISSFGTNNTITNSGRIATAGGVSSGISSFGDNNTITNSGRIATTGLESTGISSLDTNSTIINSGTIVTTGSAAVGIASLGANLTITNSGTIISEQGSAIQFLQVGATLNLLAGTAIQGGLYFSGGGNTVSFAPGLNALMTFSGAGIPGIVETSGNPYVVNGNTIAVLDRGGFVLTDDMALALAGDIAGAADGIDESCAAEAWLTGFGAFGSRSGIADIAGLEHLRGGGLVGLEFMPGGGLSGGLFIGAVAARGKVGTSQETALYGGVAGGHAGFERDGYFADFYAALGVLQIDSRRTIADNTVTGGLDLASATHVGYLFSPAVTVGTDMETGHGTLTPSLRLRYTGLMLDGYAESGASDSLVVDARTVHELELRAQLALALTPWVREDGMVSSTLRAGADVIHRQGDQAGAELLGQDIAFASGGDGTHYRGFAALELDYALNAGAGLFGSLEGGLDTTGGYSAAAQAGLRGAF